MRRQKFKDVKMYKVENLGKRLNFNLKEQRREGGSLSERLMGDHDDWVDYHMAPVNKALFLTVIGTGLAVLVALALEKLGAPKLLEGVLCIGGLAGWGTYVVLKYIVFGFSKRL